MIYIVYGLMLVAVLLAAFATLAVKLTVIDDPTISQRMADRIRNGIAYHFTGTLLLLIALGLVLGHISACLKAD